MTGNDLSLLCPPATFIIVAIVVAAAFLVPWLSDRHVRQELTRDTGVTREDPARVFHLGHPENPPLVYFLELLYADRLDNIVIMHRVGATVALLNGSMILHDRIGRVISHISGDAVAYYRALGDTPR